MPDLNTAHRCSKCRRWTGDRPDWPLHFPCSAVSFPPTWSCSRIDRRWCWATSGWSEKRKVSSIIKTISQSSGDDHVWWCVCTGKDGKGNLLEVGHHFKPFELEARNSYKCHSVMVSFDQNRMQIILSSQRISGGTGSLARSLSHAYSLLSSKREQCEMRQWD